VTNQLFRIVIKRVNRKRDSAKLAVEQSMHLYLCHLIADLTTRYGPVVFQALVVNVLDAAFDVLLPEFGIEKRVHIDQMPIEVTYFSADLLDILSKFALE
jgi:protein SSD1